MFGVFSGSVFRTASSSNLSLVVANSKQADVSTLVLRDHRKFALGRQRNLMSLYFVNQQKL